MFKRLLWFGMMVIMIWIGMVSIMSALGALLLSQRLTSRVWRKSTHEKPHKK